MAAPYSHSTAKSKKRNLSFWRIVIAGLVFLGCFVGKTQFEPETKPYFDELRWMLTMSSDWQGIIEQVGRRLEEGQSVTSAVEEWCVTVFAPQNVTPFNHADTQQQSAQRTQQQ